MGNFDKNYWSVKWASDRKQKKSQLHEKKNEKLWSCGADGWRGGVWKADGRGRSISLFQLLAGTNTDDKVTTLSLFLSPLSRALFSFPLHFLRIWFPSFSLYHISRADVACSLWHLLIVQGKSPVTSPLYFLDEFHLASSIIWRSHILCKYVTHKAECTEWNLKYI